MGEPTISVHVTVTIEPATIVALMDLARALMAMPTTEAPKPAQEIPRPAKEAAGQPVPPSTEEQGAARVPPAPPPPTPPKPTSAAEVMSGRRVWTVERNDLVRKLYPAGVPVSDLLDRVNDLPGPPVSSAAGLRVHAINDLGLLRPPGISTNASLPPVPRAPQADRTEVTYTTAFQWAGERGLASTRDGMDIERVNCKRLELGLPPFVILPAMPQRPRPATL